MKELLKNIKKISYKKCKNLTLIDTCFLIYAIEHNLKLNFKNLAFTSFNIDEVLFIEHKLDHEIRKGLRNFFKLGNFVIVDIPIHPGNKDSEKEFVDFIDKGLLQKISDPSDAVLIATAIVTKSNVLTKDKHHLFTTKLENFLNKYGIKVFKDFHTL